MDWVEINALSRLTSQGNWELRVDYQLKNGTESYFYYNKFEIGSAKDQYPLTISRFDSIGLTDPFYTRPLQGMKFTTRDRDNDLWNNGNCERHEGGWWHRSCSNIYLNAVYNRILIILNGQFHYPTFVEMKIRPQNCDIN